MSRLDALTVAGAFVGALVGAMYAPQILAALARLF